ncbi:MAG: hypothetical protein JWM20_781 [Patescibacteria group bacterium]|nr:hypothetical protein [Patescibacteria group bacterium]
MNNPSQLQQQFPLSPKKMNKKMIGVAVSGTILGIVGAIIAVSVSMVSSIGSANAGTTTIVSALCAFAIVFIIRYIIGVWYWKSYIRSYFYDASDAFLTIRKGVFTPTEIHVQYQKIQDVYVDQDLWDRILGIYDVHIASATATSGIEAHIDGVDGAVAEALKNLLLSSIKNGGLTPSNGSSAQPVQAAAPAAPLQSRTFQSAQEVSQNTFPISGIWIFQKVISSIFSSVVAVVFYWFVAIRNTAQIIGGTAAQGAWSTLGTVVIIFFIVLLFQIGSALIWRSNFKFQFMPDYVYARQGIISVEEKHLPYGTIQDVVMSQSFFERIFGIATVTIQNAAAAQMVGRRMVSSGIALVGQPLAKAQELSAIAKGIMAKQGQNQTGL